MRGERAAAQLTDRDRRCGRYELLARLGGGGSSDIFLARLDGLDGFAKHVFLKRLLPELALDRRVVESFLAEAIAAAPLSHGNVCNVRDCGAADGTYFIVYEHLQGVPLTHVLRGEALDRSRRAPGARDLRLAAGLLEQAAEGLHAAHELGVTHRSLGPQALYVTTEGELKILDLGLPPPEEFAQRTGPGLAAHYAYLSPEQLEHGIVDRRSNVFSLGAILFELVTGRALFVRESDYLSCRAVLEAPIPYAHQERAGVPLALSGAIARALSRDPLRRYATTRDFAEAVLIAIRPLGGQLAPHAIATELQEGTVLTYSPLMTIFRQLTIPVWSTVKRLSSKAKRRGPSPRTFDTSSQRA